MIAAFACAGCAFWHYEAAMSSPAVRLGQCRAHAPRLVERPDGRLRSAWPFTAADDGCGDHATPSTD